ncbi:glycogen debranching N-terminal domain-containing protein [Streptomyces sp. BE20]|uniref:glycogen debranching N-terminal domain-containing protein n=1 Tax=Streptomyces sp. BE20 TaxID=3002525 RepID=UPI002E783499|nr:glycogen debranching N-terminal domain-containing protein [Streptomyces sp. BE20]MEE1826391.1 glycogen debranching N-terminal domain-containing protein [Streptomyces sp. BE20]
MRPPQAMPAESVVGAPRPVGRPDPAQPGAPGGQARSAPPRPQPAAAHHAVLCVNAPAMAASGPDGQLRGHGLHGFYRSGVRVVARMELRLGGIEPLPLQGTLTTAAQARFLGAVRLPGDLDPDPALTVERLRHADGVETVTVRNTGSRAARLPLEIALGTDLGPVGEIAAGHRPPDLPGQVQSSGLRWAGPTHSAAVSAQPSPHAVLAGAGVLRWDLEVQPGARWSVELRAELETTLPGPRPPGGRGTGVPLPWAEPEVRCDDPRAALVVARSLDALGGLLFADPDRPTDLYPASGAPWRFGLAPADALWAARLALPLGTRLAAGTLRALARRQQPAPAPGQGGHRPEGLLPGALRHGGPELPPTCTATEATLLFVTVLAEAWRWGLPRQEVAELLPAAERALAALREGLVDGFVTDLSRPVEERSAHPVPARAEVQAQAHRAALHGADLLAAFGRPGAEEWRSWAAGLRARFRDRFWVDDLSGGRPAAGLAPGGQPLPAVASSLVHLLDPGLSAEGGRHESLLDREQTRLLAHRLAAPELDSGWGLRTLSAKSPRFNPLGHRSGAVRVHETALAVAGLAEAGHENEAGALLEGLLSAAAHFEGRLPEMYAGEQRTPGCPPVPHPGACRPAAVSAAGAAHAVFALAGVRPDVPGGRVLVRPASTAPLGELELTGLRVAGEPFSVRVSRIGVAMVEEASAELQLVAR